MDPQRILDTINAHRRRHRAAELQWDSTCAAAAQNWANRGYFISDQDSWGRFGESLAVSDTNYDATTECANAINSWQGEESSYVYDNLASPGTCRFTQNVWRSTTHVGFGFSSGAVDQYGKYWASFVVAKFFPPGNIEDKFEDNVLLPGAPIA